VVLGACILFMCQKDAENKMHACRKQHKHYSVLCCIDNGMACNSGGLRAIAISHGQDPTQEFQFCRSAHTAFAILSMTADIRGLLLEALQLNQLPLVLYVQCICIAHASTC
jgi:hypothetical protein